MTRNDQFDEVDLHTEKLKSCSSWNCLLESWFPGAGCFKFLFIESNSSGHRWSLEEEKQEECLLSNSWNLP
jgi:hypothetical protein